MPSNDCLQHRICRPTAFDARAICAVILVIFREIQMSSKVVRESCTMVGNLPLFPIQLSPKSTFWCTFRRISESLPVTDIFHTVVNLPEFNKDTLTTTFLQSAAPVAVSRCQKFVRGQLVSGISSANTEYIARLIGPSYPSLVAYLRGRDSAIS